MRRVKTLGFLLKSIALFSRSSVCSFLSQYRCQFTGFLSFDIKQKNVFCTYIILDALYEITICVCIFSRPENRKRSHGVTLIYLKMIK